MCILGCFLSTSLEDIAIKPKKTKNSKFIIVRKKKKKIL